ncbi:hypothetical protein HDE_01731 [Halotydeus destructor]|nr:hypothetical protein HDE_01731 [Halotydeus destructor]
MKLAFLAIALATILASVLGADGDEPRIPRFPDIDNTASFHTRATARTRQTFQKRSVRTIFYEEFHDLALKRGRVDFTTAESSTIGLYDDATMQYVKYQTTNDDSACIVTDIKEDNADNLPWGESDVDKGEDVPLMIGPSAVWRKISRTISAADKYYNGTEEIRGILCDKFRVPLKFTDLDLQVVLYFTSASWKKFEKLDTPAPVRFLVDGTVGGVSASYEVDYFLFEPFTETWKELEPVIGVGCEKRKNPKDKIFPGQDDEKGIPKQFAATIETKVETETAIHRFELFVDYDNQIIRHDQHGGLEGVTKHIEDMRNGIAYIFVPGSTCKIGHVTNDFTLSKDKGLKRVQTVREMLSLDGEYFYLGTALARGILCDVWERVITDYQEMRRWDLADQYFGKVVVTHFFSTPAMLEVANLVPTIIQTLVTAYKAQGYYDNRVYTKLYQRELNVFNFRPLYYGRTYDNTFNVRQCFFEPEDRLYLEMLVESKSDTADLLEAHTDHLKQAIVTTLSTTLGISPLRVGQVNIGLTEFGFTINLLMLGKPPASAAFAQETEGGASSPTELDVGPYPAADEDECAEMALKAKAATGFLFCVDKCYTMTRSKYDTAKPKPGGDKIKCNMYLRDLYDADQQKAWNEPALKDIQKTLTDLVKDKKLAFTLNKEIMGDEIAEATYYVDNLQVAPDVMRRAAKRKFFQSISGSKVRADSETAAARPEVETLGACYRNCVDDQSMDCQSFSFCRTNSKVHCIISSEYLTATSAQENNQSYVESDSQCSVYAIPYVFRFARLDAMTALMPGGTAIESKLVNNVNDCAQQCTKSSTINCESFQFCRSGKCVIHETHYYDAKADGKIAIDDQCDFYSQNYLLEFTMVGSDLISEETHLELVNEISAENCAQRCSKRDDCISINYCPDNAKTPSVCYLSSKSVLDPGVEADSRLLCRHYVKTIDPPVRPKKVKAPEVESTSGFSGGSFLGLVLIMLLLGIGLGIGGFVGLNYYRSRAGQSGGGLGVSVKFMRQQDEADEA